MHTKYIMRYFKTFISSFILLGVLACNSLESGDVDEVIRKDTLIAQTTLGYDSIKAAEFGADAYGMKKYVIAFLKRGPNRDLDSAKSAELQAAHMANIGKMAEEGKLVLAGPFFGDGDLRGIYIFDVQSLEEAEALTQSDPAVQAGSLIMELKEWYGSAALMAINEIHETLAETPM